MKRNKIFQFTLILFGCFSLTFAQGNWELLIPSPTSNQMVGLYFIDDQTGWSVGEYGTILKTTDGGETWSIKEISWTFDLSDVYFPTENIGYAVGTDGFIIKSTDGGDSWSQLNNQYVNNINRVLFKDENTGWLICEKGLILFTDNGGESWQQQQSHSNSDLLGVDNVGTNGLCIVGMDNIILTSQNDGKEWSVVEYSESQYDFYDVFFRDGENGWIGGNGVLLKTSDGGVNWIRQEIGQIDYYEIAVNNTFHMGTTGENAILNQVFFYNDGLTGIAGIAIWDEFFNQCLLLNSVDAGQNWEGTVYGNGEKLPMYGRFCVLSGNRVVRTGYCGNFLYSNDKGKTWHYFDEEKRFWQEFVVGKHGKAVCHKHNISQQDGSDTYLRSNDYGTTWQTFTPQFFDADGKLLNALAFDLGSLGDDEETLWAVNQRDMANAYLFTSIDFGLTYHEVHRDFKRSAREIDVETYFLTSDTLISYSVDAVETTAGQYKSNLKFLYSYDSGLSFITVNNLDIWNDITPPKAPELDYGPPTASDHYFLDGHEGFIVGKDGNIIRTTNTGKTWENIYSGVVENLWDIEFINRQIGFVVGDFGRILKTSDGGLTWRKTNSNTQENIYCVGFVNEQEGWVGTENGLRYTIDGGETWQGVPLRYAHGAIKSLIFDPDGNGYAYTLSITNLSYMESSGTYLYMLRLVNNDVAVDPVDREGTEPSTFSLSPNYPNPFNSSTRIEYNLPNSGDVLLKIFNIQGQLVRTLVNRTQEPGSHSAIWNGHSDAGSLVGSGVYIYQLECGDQIKQQKLLLLK